MLRDMTSGWQRGVNVLAFLMSWAAIWLLAVDLTLASDTASMLAGLVVVVAAVAALVLVWRADDPLFGLSRTTRGPTAEEQRLRGAFRRHSHPDTPGRPRSRAPGPFAGAVPSASI
jgi:Family of unknown function (DUF6412)